MGSSTGAAFCFLKTISHKPIAPLITGAFLLPLPCLEGKKGEGEVADVSEALRYSALQVKFL